MSTSIPLLPEADIDAVVSWMKRECKKPLFDPYLPEFQAAIALVASSDKSRQAKVLRLISPENTFAITPKDVSDEQMTKMFRVALFRNITRSYQTQPQIQRGAFPMPSSAHPEIPDSSAFSLEFLTPHQNSQIPMDTDPFSAFRASFLAGAGQGPEFLAERRLAMLSYCAQQQKNVPWINSEAKIVSMYSQQLKIRQELVRFSLDPMGANLPDFSTRFLQAKPEPFHYISPQHVGIITAYDIASGVEHTKKATRINSLLQQANQFRIKLNSKMKGIIELNNILGKRIKSHDKDKKRQSGEASRMQALKKNDIQEYRRLVNEMKDSRIKILLDKTDKYMKDLSDRIKTTHATISEGKTDNLYDLGITLPDDVVQPTHLNGNLKDYQLRGLQWLVSLYNSDLNGILADEMGLGKTIQTIALLAWLWEVKKDAGPHLICAPLGTLPNWLSEFEKWLPVFNVVQYSGDKPHRKELQNTYIVKGSNTNVVLTSFEFATRDKSTLGRLEYTYLIIDEAHKLKNDQGKLSLALSTYKCHHRLLLTGTPLQNNPRELWSLLNFVLPKIFNDHTQFEEWFAAPFGKNNDNVALTKEEQFLVINQLHAVLRPFLFRRLSCEVANELPDMVESKIICAMSSWQKCVYKTIVEESSFVAEGPKVVRVDNQTMQLRKVCNHPFLFYESYFINANLIRASGKFEVLDKILPKLKATDHRVLIFSQMTEVLNLLEDLLKYLDHKYLRLDGSTKGESRQQLIKEFNDPQSEAFVFLLSTRAGGLGLNLQTADTVILYDNDWNPFADQQARSRVHRIGQEKPVLVVNLVTANSIEEKVLDRADQKKSLESKIIEVGRFDDTSNLDDRKKLYQQIVDQDSSENDSHVHNNEQINHILARSQEEFDIFQKMDVERMRLYQKQWEEGGHTGKYTNLIAFEELPSYLKIPFQELIKDDDLPPIRKSRSTNFSAKLENMTDNEYARLIDRGEDPTEHINDVQTRADSIESLTSAVEEICKGYFDTLPTREELPIYYERISHPITFLEIKSKVKSGVYENMQELIVDMKLMANNALIFNDPNSEYASISRNIIQLCDESISTGEIHREMPDDASFDFD